MSDKYGTVYWIDEVNGDDTNDGLEVSSPVKTKGRVIELLTAKDPEKKTHNLIIYLPGIDLTE